MPWAAFWQLDRDGSNPTPSLASPSLLAATPTMLRGMQRIDTAVYWSLTSCHSVFVTFGDGCLNPLVSQVVRQLGHVSATVPINRFNATRSVKQHHHK